MEFEKIKKELEKISPNSQIKFDLSIIDTKLTIELAKYVKFKYPNLLYLWGANYQRINEDIICLSGEYKVKITDTYFRIAIFIVRGDKLNYYLTIQPRNNWLNEVGGDIKSLIEKIKPIVSIDFSQTVFIFSTLSIDQANIIIEKIKYGEYQKIKLRIEEGKAIIAEVRSSLFELIGLKDYLFLIKELLNGNISVNKEVNLQISLASILDIEMRRVSFDNHGNLSFTGELSLPFPDDTLVLQTTFSITPDRYHASILLEDEVKLPIQTLLKGLRIANVKIDLHGSFIPPNDFVYGLAGDFAIGEPVTHINEHDFSYSTLKTNEFNLKFKPDTNSYIPVFIQAYIKDVSLSKAIVLLTDKNIKLPSFLDPITFYETYIYYCAPTQNSILLNGIPAKKGLAISSGIEVLGLKAYAEFRSIEGEGVSGNLAVEPIEVEGIISIKGTSEEGSPEGYNLKPIPKGGLSFSFLSSERQFEFKTDISIKVLNFLKIETIAEFDSNGGLTFKSNLNFGLVNLNLKSTLKSIQDFKIDAYADINGLGIKIDLDILGKLSVNLNIYGDILFKLVNLKPNTSTSFGFKFNGKEIQILDINLNLQDIENLETLLRNKIEVWLRELLSIDPLEWLNAILEGVIVLADNIIKEAEMIASILISHFRKGVLEAAKLLQAAHFAINRVSLILQKGFNQTINEIANILHELKYEIGDIVKALNEQLEQTALKIAKILKQLKVDSKIIFNELKNKLGVLQLEAAKILKELRYSVTELVKVIKDLYNINSSEAMARILKEIEYGASDIAAVLKDVYGASRNVIDGILRGLGYSARSIGGVLDDIFGGIGGGCLNDNDILYSAIANYENGLWYKRNRLVQFRDEYLIMSENGKELLRRYNETSANILLSANQNDLNSYFAFLYHDVAIPAVAFIEEEMNEKVLNLFENKLDYISKITNINELDMSKLVNMIAGPLNVWGPEKEVYSVLGANAGCKISVFENNTNGNIRIQVRHNTDVSSGDWYEYNEGNFIKAQVVHCRLASTSTGGSVIIKIE